MNDTEQKNRDFLHVAILAAVSAAMGIYLIADSVLICKDGVFYIGQAQRIAGDVLGVAKRYPPGYPLLLFAAHAVTRFFNGSDSATAWAFSSQAATLLCRTLALVVLYFAGKRLVGPQRSFHAVAILSFLPYAAHDGSDVLREWPFLLFIATGLWLVLWAVQEQKWWAFGWVGLLAGLGYLIHPTCGQIVIYGLLGLLLMKHEAGWRLRSAGAGLTLAAGFALAAAPLMIATGQIVPQQLRQSSENRPAVILSVAGRPAGDDPIRVSTREGQSLELAVETLDVEDDDLKFSAVLIPVGSRPIYRFCCPANNACFLTLSEREKDSLLMGDSKGVWAYDGIAYYAYAYSNDAAGLRPVYRLWSPVHSRHFYTTDKSQLKALLDGSSGNQWMSEGIAFYVPTEDRRPPDAVPVHRFQIGGQGCFWSVEQLPPERFDSNAVYDGIAWYAFGGRQLPAGLTFSRGILQWRPGSELLGVSQLNLVVSNQQYDSCQIVQIDVQKAQPDASVQGIPSDTRSQVSPSANAVRSDPVMSTGPAKPTAGERDNIVLRSVKALDAIVGGVAENLMVFFLLPLCIGLVHRWRHGASRQERVLMMAVVVVNVGLMFARYVWVEAGSVRRYSIPVVALTIFYVPVGLGLMARWLANRWDLALGRRRPDLLWLYVLTAIGIAICVPKLMRPLGEGKESYRLVAQWLRDNTRTDAAVAVPDRRIASSCQPES